MYFSYIPQLVFSVVLFFPFFCTSHYPSFMIPISSVLVIPYSCVLMDSSQVNASQQELPHPRSEHARNLKRNDSSNHLRFHRQFLPPLVLQDLTHQGDKNLIFANGIKAHTITKRGMNGLTVLNKRCI